jgi:hypothetical protein
MLLTRRKMPEINILECPVLGQNQTCHIDPELAPVHNPGKQY